MGKSKSIRSPAFATFLLCSVKMPLVKRAIAPVFISRAQLPKEVKNELEGVVVNTLAGIIKQLSSLSKHAENLFGELFSEASNIYRRSANLNNRVTGLKERIKGLDATQKGEGMEPSVKNKCAQNYEAYNIKINVTNSFLTQSKWRIWCP